VFTIIYVLFIVDKKNLVCELFRLVYQDKPILLILSLYCLF